MEIIAFPHRINRICSACIPIAEKISQHIVNLPTRTKISENYVARIAKFLKKNRDNIYSSCGEIAREGICR